MNAVTRPLGRVLRAHEAGLYNDAAEAMVRAEAAARALRAAVLRDAEAERARILADASREAHAQAGLLIAEAARLAQARLEGIQAELGAAIADGVASIIGGIDVAERVSLAAAHAVAGLSQRQQATVRVPPAAAAGTAARLAPWGAALRVQPDESLAADGCVVESEAGFVRADLSAQLALLTQALRDA